MSYPITPKTKSKTKSLRRYIENSVKLFTSQQTEERKKKQQEEDLAIAFYPKMVVFTVVWPRLFKFQKPNVYKNRSSFPIDL